MKKMLIVFLAGTCVVGCKTPQAVLDLSDKTVTTSEQYQKTLIEYFALIEGLVKDQITLAELQIKELEEDNYNILKQKAKLQLKDASVDVDKVLTDYAAEVKKESSGSLGNQGKLQAAFAGLKTKHVELLTCHQRIVDAQRKLQDYLRTEKADEVFVRELATTIGIEKGKMSSIAAEMKSKLEDINSLVNLFND
jgi:hypothetical protein